MNSNVTKSVLAALLLASGSMSEAATYYVSDTSNAAVNVANLKLVPAGAKVFTTLQAAASYSALAPGDTVLVLNGTYKTNPAVWNSAVLNVTTSGTAGKPIVFAAYSGHAPILTTAGNPKTWNTVDINANYVTVRGFEIIGNSKAMTLAQATASANAGKAAYIANKTVPANPYADTGGIIVHNKHHVMIQNNNVHDCGGTRIGAEMSDYITITGNVVHNTSWWTSFDSSGINIHRALNSDANTGYKIVITDNISYNNANTQSYYLDAVGAKPTDGNGIIIDLNQQTNDGKPYVGRTLIAGNVLFNNGGSGAHTYKSAHVDIVNNTAYNNNTCPVAGSTCGGMNEGQLFANSSSDVKIYNNVSVAPSGKRAYLNYANTNVLEDYNLWYNGDSAAIGGGVVMGGHDVINDPDFNAAKSLIPGSTYSAGVILADLSLPTSSRANNRGLSTIPSVNFKATGYYGLAIPNIDLGALPLK